MEHGTSWRVMERWLIAGILFSLTSTGRSMSDPAPRPLSPRAEWTITASTQEENLLPEHAADGSPTTRWSSAFADGQWWMIDFGREEIIGSFSLLWEAAHARAYTVLAAGDDGAWVEIHTASQCRGGHEIVTFPARPVRRIKLDLRERATEWGFSIYEISFNPWRIAQASWGLTARASSGTRDYDPARAIDGNPATRWSSDFNDAEWIDVIFPQPTTLNGLTIFWETAFAEKYSVQISADLENWTTVYDVESGDGGPDHLFFAPVKATAVRINCRQRGTGWGHSIWDIRFYTDELAPRLTSSSHLDGSGPDQAMDGQLDSAWRHRDDDEQPDLTITLPERMALGGLVLTWLDGFASEYDLQLSVDGQNWETVARPRNGNGGEDYHYFPAISAEHIRVLILKAGSDQRPALARIELKGGEEQATPIRHYQAKAKNIRADLFPMWLSRQQEYWTITGLPAEPNETLLSETGIIEPQKGGFSVQPFIMDNGKLHSWADVTIQLALTDDVLPLPSATWSTDRWSLEIAVVMSGPPGARFTTVRYRFTPRAGEITDARLALAIRPVQLNPGWQHGGYSPIHEGRLVPGKGKIPTIFYVGERVRMISPVNPTSLGVAALSDGDISEFLLAGTMPATLYASDTEGKVGAGLIYPLAAQAGQSTDIVVVYPLGTDPDIPAELLENPPEAFEQALGEKRKLWADILSKPRIDIPEKQLIDVMKSNLGYILINRDGPWFKPGPRNYNHAWMRDGVLTAVATLRCGITNMTREFIETYTKHIRADGWVPWMILESGEPITFNPDPESGEGQEYDSQGQYPFIVRQYLDYTGDDEWVRQYYPAVVSAIRYGAMLRQRRMTNEYRTDPDKQPYFGILPHSNSHEGYYPAKHSHWDNFWMLRGLKDATYLAERFGHPEDAAWMRTEEKELREALYKSIRTVAERAGIDIIPGCVELADADPTSTTMAIMVADELEHLPQPLGTNTFEYYWKELESRIPPGRAKIYTPYEVRNADAFVRMGWRDRALAALRYFLHDAVRPRAWNHMAEVVHVHPRAPAYIGDMPHTWVGADYVNAVRSLFVFEDVDRLVIGAGIDAAWLDHGVTVEDLPTQFGPVSYRMIMQNGELDIVLNHETNPTGGIFLHLPPLPPGTPVRLNEIPVELNDGILKINPRQAAALIPEDPLVLEWLKQVQDTTTPEQQLLGSMQDQQLQTFNNALAAIAFIVKGEHARAERILDFFSAATDRDNRDPLRQNFFLNGEARGFFQYAVRQMENGRVVYRGEPSSDRWMGDLFWLLFAYKHYDQANGPGRYDEIQSLLHDLLVSWYKKSPYGPGGFVQHGWRQGDRKLHEPDGHHEGNIDAYAYFIMVGDRDRAASIRAWIESAISGNDLPLDLYSWRVLAYGPDAAELLEIPDGDSRFRKTVTFRGREVVGVWHGPDAHIHNNIWIDGVGHMACSFFAAGDETRGNFYANQMDALLIDIDINGVATRSIPYTAGKNGGYDWVNLNKGFVSTAAWYIFAKNRFNPMMLTGTETP